MKIKESIRYAVSKDMMGDQFLKSAMSIITSYAKRKS